MAIPCAKPDNTVVAVISRKVSAGCYGNPTYCSGTNNAFLPAITVCQEKFFTGNEPVITPGVNPLAPGADFVAVPTSGQPPLIVQFVDHSTKDPTSWLWDFGDGQTSVQQNPQHTYISAGIFIVKLTVTNEHGSSARIGRITVSNSAATISPSGIASAEAFGTTTVTRGSSIISLTGIASAEAFGTTVVTGGTPITNLLDFSSAANSQYLPLM